MIRKNVSLFLLIVTLVFLAGAATTSLPGCGAAWSDEEGQDYGYWCTQCGRQHGPGESCPANSSPSNSTPDEPYDWSQPTYSSITTTTTKTFAQWAVEYNAEGEEFYRNGEYHKAWEKFFAAAFNDPDTPLYKENREKANDAIGRQMEEKKKQQQELASRMQKAPHHQRIKNVQPFGTSVVDLHDKKGAVNLTDVKGPVAKQRGLKIKAPPSPSESLLWSLIEEMQLAGGKKASAAKKQQIFEKNRDKFLTNPLWTKEKLAKDTVRAMENDKEYVAARNKYKAEADKAIFEAQLKLLEMAGADLNELRKKTNCKNLSELEIECEFDPVLKQKVHVITVNYQDEIQIVSVKYNTRLDEQMAEETKKFYQRHPELKSKGG